MERVVPSDGLIDFDTGNVSEIPSVAVREELDQDRYQGATWMRKNGIDLRAAGNALIWYDATFTSLRSEDWDTLTPSELKGRLENGSTANPPITQTVSKMLLLTDGFKTREGGLGILQISGFADNPRGVKIRYKLVQQGK
jgi:hypothetical protein